MICQLLVLKNGQQIVAGTLSLGANGIIAHPVPGHEALCKNVIASPVLVNSGTVQVSAQSNPHRWFAALPANYSGTYLRARLVNNVAAEGTSEGAVKGWDTRGRGKGKPASSSKGMTLYHGTASELEASILKDGLIPARAKGADSWAKQQLGAFATFAHKVGNNQRPASVYMAPKLDEAKYFARYAVQQNPGSKAVIMKVVIPPDQVGKLKSDEADASGQGLRYEGKIPPSWISPVSAKEVGRANYGLPDPNTAFRIAAGAGKTVYIVLLAKPDVQAYGTSDGTNKAWDTRGRGRKVDPKDLAKIKFAPSGELKQGVAKNAPSDRMKRALANRVPCGAAKQKIADEEEELLSKTLGIPRTRNNSSFDLRNDKVGVEIKTMIDTKNGRVSMEKAPLARKRAEQQKDGLKGYTVVADKRQGRTQYYCKEGFGSFRLGGMTPVSLAQLKGMIKA